jgi:hypothetical protein
MNELLALNLVPWDEYPDWIDSPDDAYFFQWNLFE